MLFPDPALLWELDKTLHNQAYIFGGEKKHRPLCWLSSTKDVVYNELITLGSKMLSCGSKQYIKFICTGEITHSNVTKLLPGLRSLRVEK